MQWEAPLKLVRRHRLGLSTGILVLALFPLLGGKAAWPQGEPIVEVRAAEPGGLLAEGYADRIRSIEGVKGVEKYILQKADPHAVIGVEPGAPLRVLEGGRLLPPEKGAGRWFRPGDRYVAIVGNVYVEDYPGFRLGHAMPMMRHRFEIDSSFTLPKGDRSVQVVGKFAVEPPEAAKKLVLPLSTIQEFFRLRGRVTHFFVTVRSPELAQKVSDGIRSLLGEEVSLRVHEM
ncbi:MAG: hypothetical protein ACE5JS_07835 [Nitrospinota bacterium]